MGGYSRLQQLSKNSIDGLLKMERFMTIELVQFLYKASELSLFKNWGNYLDDTPLLMNENYFRYKKFGLYKKCL